jgi:hypothetical protein
VIVAILSAINFLANRHNKSIDSTEQVRLSDQTIEIVKGLPKDVTITDYDKTSAFTARDLSTSTPTSPQSFTSSMSTRTRSPDAKAVGIRSYGQIIVDSGNKKEEAKSYRGRDHWSLIRSLRAASAMRVSSAAAAAYSLEDSSRTGIRTPRKRWRKQLQDEDRLATQARRSMASSPIPD